MAVGSIAKGRCVCVTKFKHGRRREAPPWEQYFHNTGGPLLQGTCKFPPRGPAVALPKKPAGFFLEVKS